MRDRADRRDRNQVVAAEAADLALDAALLVRALDARRGEQRLEQVVRAHRDEPVGLDPPAALEDLLDRRAQVVVADLAEHAIEPLERVRVTLQERLLSLHRRRHAERRPGEAGAHEEQMHPRPRAGQIDLRLAPVDLSRHRRRVHLRDEHLARGVTELAPALADIVTDRRLGDLGAVLVDQPPPDPLGGVPLLARRVKIRDQPLVDQRAILTELRRRPRQPAPAAPAAAATPTPAAPPGDALHAAPPSARIDKPSRSRSRLICSNNSTLDPTSCRPPFRAR